MVLNQIDSKLMSDRDDSTIYTTITPPETAAADILDHHDPFGSAEPSFFLVPWPGSTFVIRSVSSGHVITLLDGQIMLTQPGDRLDPLDMRGNQRLARFPKYCLR